MPKRLLPSLFTLAMLALSASALPALAADQATAVSRARSHIVDFPGRSLHGTGHSYEVRDVILDADGAEHVRFDRRYQGLAVIGGDMVVHTSRNGSFVNTSLTLNRLIDMPIQPSLNAGRALQAALAGHPGDARGVAPTLVIYARGDLPALAWDVRVFGEQDDGTPSEKHVIVDAHVGLVLDAWDDIHTGTGQGFFNGTVSLTTDSISSTSFALRDPSRGYQYTVDMKNKQGGTGTLFTDTNDAWGNGTLSDRQTVGVDAQYGTAVTWDYYLNVHGRSGIKGNGQGAYNRVHYGRNYNNAFWSDSCFCMTYGDGDGVTFNPFDSLDVAGHEMTHGVTSRTANLTYSGESGGLNEATSDIFGTMVEYYASNGSDTPDYKIGEKLYRNNPGDAKALRYMYSPNLDGASADCWYSGLGSLNVHYSSGVANHFFYLLAEGTTNGSPSPTCVAGNTKQATGKGTLTGIGRAAAEKIWYRALTVYMTSNTDYAGARTATLNAAQALYSEGKISAADQGAVGTAWTAVLVTGN